MADNYAFTLIIISAGAIIFKGTYTAESIFIDVVKTNILAGTSLLRCLQCDFVFLSLSQVEMNFSKALK